MYSSCVTELYTIYYINVKLEYRRGRLLYFSGPVVHVRLAWYRVKPGLRGGPGGGGHCPRGLDS